MEAVHKIELLSKKTEENENIDVHLSSEIELAKPHLTLHTHVIEPTPGRKSKIPVLLRQSLKYPFL